MNTKIKCPHCGEEIAEGMRFCHSCGKEIIDERQAEAEEKAALTMNWEDDEPGKTRSEETLTMEDVDSRLAEMEKRLKRPSTPPVAQGGNGDGKKFRSMGEYFKAVRDAGIRGARGLSVDPRMKELATRAAMQEGTDSEGGFLVSEEYIPRLQELMVEQEVIRPYATVFSTKKDSCVIPCVADSSHASHLFGGVRMYWTEEEGAKTEAEPTMRQVRWIPRKLAAYAIASDELIEDSDIGIEPMLARMFTKAGAFYEDEAFINGTGVGQPLGWMNSGATVVTAAEPAQAANTIVYENLVHMLERLLPGSHRSSNTVWLANPDTLAQLLLLNMTIGTAGVAVWHSDAKGYPQLQLLGRPLLLSEKMQQLGTQGDIALCDLSYYWIADRKGMTLDYSQHYRFIYDQMTYRFVKRVDGKSIVDTPLTPLRGTNTLSPYVVLATRP